MNGTLGWKHGVLGLIYGLLSHCQRDSRLPAYIGIQQFRGSLAVLTFAIVVVDDVLTSNVLYCSHILTVTSRIYGYLV